MRSHTHNRSAAPAGGGGAIGRCCVLSGCLSHPEPLIDTQGVNMAQLEQDLETCEGYGDQVRIENGVAKGTVAGGAVGAATGAVFGDAGPRRRGRRDRRRRALRADRRAREVQGREELHALPGLPRTELTDRPRRASGAWR